MVEGENKISGNQKQVQDILFRGEIGWKEIIFDLIHSEELDPWDIDISILADSFFERISKYEELDFFISGQVLLAASFLLRLKSELLLNRYLRSVDEILFGETEKKKVVFERLELDEDIPELVLKSPLPRYKKVTLNELIDSLNKAIITENRRIKKTIVNQNALREMGILAPKKSKIKKRNSKFIHGKLLAYFDANKSHKSVDYKKFVGEDPFERAISFFPMLQLEMTGDVWLENSGNFGDVNIWLKSVYLKNNPDPFGDLKAELGEFDEEELKRLGEVDKMGKLIE